MHEGTRLELKRRITQLDAEIKTDTTNLASERQSLNAMTRHVRDLEERVEQKKALRTTLDADLLDGKQEAGRL